MRREARQERLERLCGEITEAAQRQDARSVWRLARCLAGKGLGQKKRQLHSPPRWGPSLTQWLQHLQQCGQNGGCSAKGLWRGCSGQLGAFWNLRAHFAQPLQIYPSEEVQDLANDDALGLTMAIENSKFGKAVPRWSCPSLLWRIAAAQPSIRALLERLCLLIRTCPTAVGGFRGHPGAETWTFL